MVRNYSFVRHVCLVKGNSSVRMSLPVPEAENASNLLETFTHGEGNDLYLRKQPYPVYYADVGQFGELLGFPGDLSCTLEEHMTFILSLFFCLSVFYYREVLAMTLKGEIIFST